MRNVLRPAIPAALLALAAALAAPDRSRAEPATTGTAAVPPPAARTLYLVRHGAYDEQDQRDARTGKALTPLGVAQARLLGARLRGMGGSFDAVLSSPMTRALETARTAASELGVELGAIERVEDLAECTPPTRRADIMASETPEDLAACAAQLERLARRLLAPAAGGARRDLVFAHGNVIRSLVTRALDVDPLAWLVMSIGHASLTVVRVEANGAVRLVAVGDVGHLPPPLQSGSILDPPRDLRVP